MKVKATKKDTLSHIVTLLPLLKEIEDALTEGKSIDERYHYTKSYIGSDERVAQVTNLLRRQIAMNTHTPTAIETSLDRVGIYGANDHVISIKKERIPDTIKALTDYLSN